MGGLHFTDYVSSAVSDICCKSTLFYSHNIGGDLVSPSYRSPFQSNHFIHEIDVVIAVTNFFQDIIYRDGAILGGTAPSVSVRQQCKLSKVEILTFTDGIVETFYITFGKMLHIW